MEADSSLARFMKESQALTKRAQYTLVYQRGRTWIGSLVVMKALPNGLGLSRYGFAVTKKVGKEVERNRLKRLLREIMRLQSIKAGWDIVFIVRREAAIATYHQLKEAVTKSLAQAQLLRSNNEAVGSSFD